MMNVDAFSSSKKRVLSVLQGDQSKPSKVKQAPEAKLPTDINQRNAASAVQPPAPFDTKKVVAASRSPIIRELTPVIDPSDAYSGFKGR